jgi:hypothetical protein
MPFPWCYSSVPEDYAGSFPRKREAMYLAEIEDRAALLYRLRYPKAAAVARLRGNLEWDFELHRIPKLLERVETIVDAVYQRGGRAGGAPEP